MAAPSPASPVELNQRTANLLVVEPGHPVGQPCPNCCHWILPTRSRADAILEFDAAGAPRRFTVPLRFHEWLAYHHHVVTHQQLDRQAEACVVEDTAFKVMPA